MNEVIKAYALDAEKKQLALELYKKCAAIIVNPDYRPACECAFTDLSALFGMHWFMTRRYTMRDIRDPALYAGANNAFNYANFRLGARNKFVALTSNLVPEHRRVSNKRILNISRQLDQVLTAVTAERVSAAMRAA